MKHSSSLRLSVALALGGALALATTAPPAFAIGTTVGLGLASSYSVLGGQSVSNTGLSTLSGNVGVSPGTSVTGFPPGIAGGVIHINDAHALQAQSDLTTAYNAAASQAPDAGIPADLGGLILTPGVYKASSATKITGPLVLDGKGDPNAVFVFQIGSSLTAATDSSVVLLNQAQACHIFWQVASSATLGTGSTFVGTIMALTSISANTGATVHGRALARNGSVTLDDNVFTDSSCATATGSPTGTATVNATASASRSGAVSAGGLADTGGPSGPLLWIGVGALLAGVALVTTARRRRTT